MKVFHRLIAQYLGCQVEEALLYGSVSFGSQLAQVIDQSLVVFDSGEVNDILLHQRSLLFASTQQLQVL